MCGRAVVFSPDRRSVSCFKEVWVRNPEDKHERVAVVLLEPDLFEVTSPATQNKRTQRLNLRVYLDDVFLRYQDELANTICKFWKEMNLLISLTTYYREHRFLSESDFQKTYVPL